MQRYQQIVDDTIPNPPYIKNAGKAFLVGGFICLIGQCMQWGYMKWFGFTEQEAGDPVVATLVFLSMIATGFGYYKKLGQFAGAGSAVPVTGFGNAMISAAIEHRTEGYVLGTAANMFKLAGSVIAFGVLAAFIVGVIKTTLVTLGWIEW